MALVSSTALPHLSSLPRGTHPRLTLYWLAAPDQHLRLVTYLVLCSEMLALDLNHLLQVRQLCVVRTQNERVSRDYYQLLGQLQDMTAVGQPVTGALPPILESGGVEDGTEQVSGCQRGLVRAAVLNC